MVRPPRQGAQAAQRTEGPEPPRPHVRGRAYPDGPRRTVHQIAEARNATGFRENARAGRGGGAIAGKARRELEKKTGAGVVTGDNFLPPKREKQSKALPESPEKSDNSSRRSS